MEHHNVVETGYLIKPMMYTDTLHIACLIHSVHMAHISCKYRVESVNLNIYSLHVVIDLMDHELTIRTVIWRYAR